MSKRLIFFGPLPPPFGGVSVFVSRLLAHLKNYDIQMWTLYGKEATDQRIVRIKHRRLEVLAALKKYAAGARIIDFTHFHLEYPNKILLPIWLTAKLTLNFEWFKYILDGSLPARYQEFNTVQRGLFKSAVNAVDQFIVVSKELRDWLRDDMKVEKTITVIPCLLTIPEEMLHQALPPQTPPEIATFREHSYRVCSIGAFIPAYGFHHVANAVDRLRTEIGEDIGLLLLDGAFASEEGFRKHVLANRKWITVVTNAPNSQVYQILRESDLFVRASSAEGYGISRVEAVWCGLPVIATDVGETRGMRVYQYGDEEQLRELIRETLFTGDRAKLLAETDRWSKQFQLEAEINLKSFIEKIELR